MCLAVPGKVISSEGPDKVIVDVKGNRIAAWSGLVENVKPGEFVLVHAGCVIGRLDEEEAGNILGLLDRALDSNASS